MPSITRIDFVPLPTQDVERATAFYRDVLGLEESPHTVGKPFTEFDLGDTTLAIWDPASAGREFQANTNAVALHTDDVAGLREELAAKGVAFFGDTLDTGVCHMAFFADPDGNPLMLHARYAPRD
ncbi:VOC family protein [Patulibacter sp. SYSU D01012]|uniref:VOC family protein n=1 Tax=Patulibacter sp. SYSU D01012 TaxID=2817381 RepID=UPI001B30CC9B|nr:VOC family protein [Patulibacter sp. SYSU D01012]